MRLYIVAACIALSFSLTHSSALAKPPKAKASTSQAKQPPKTIQKTKRKSPVRLKKSTSAKAEAARAKAAGEALIRKERRKGMRFSSQTGRLMDSLARQYERQPRTLYNKSMALSSSPVKPRNQRPIRSYGRVEAKRASTTALAGDIYIRERPMERGGQ